VPKEPSYGPQTTLQGKAGYLVSHDNWVQLHTNATLLKPAKHCSHKTLQGHEKAI